MALIRKAGRQRDFRKGSLGRAEAVAGKFDPQIANVIANRTAMDLPEDARQVRRVHSNRTSNLIQTQRLRKLRPQGVSDPLKPTRWG